MSVRIQQSLTGFIASDPQLTFTSQGDARFYARVGQEQFRRLDDGSFEQTGVEYVDLVQFRKAAEHAFAQFRPGDRFIAEGYPREYEGHGADGTSEKRAEFVARKLGHDCARTAYSVDRSSRRTANPPEPGAAESNRPAPAPASASVSAPARAGLAM